MCHTVWTLRILFNTPARRPGIQSLTAVGCGIRSPLSNANMRPGYLSDPECQGPLKPIPTCSIASSVTFNIPTLYSICKPKRLNVIQHVGNLTVYFVLGNNLYIRTFNPWLLMFMNLAFRKCISQCLLGFPLMLIHGNMF